MKRNFWLILAVLALLGMIIMPTTAHSAVIAVPTELPNINIPRLVLPNYPIPMGSLKLTQVQLSAPQLQASLIPAVVPTVVEVAPVAAAPVAVAKSPFKEAPAAPVYIAPQSVIPSSRIEGISAGRKARKNIGSALAGLTSNNKESRLPSAAKMAALFDGATQPGPVAVEVTPVQSAPVDAAEDTSLTLPESDLAEEIGLGY